MATGVFTANWMDKAALNESRAHEVRCVLRSVAKPADNGEAGRGNAKISQVGKYAYLKMAVDQIYLSNDREIISKGA